MRYDTLSQCSGATNVPKEVLRLAKTRGAPGFVGHYIDWDLAGPWILSNRDELDEYLSTSIGELNKEKKREEIENLRLVNLKLKRLYLEPEDVKNFLISMATVQSSMLKKLPKELAPRVIGKPIGEVEQILEAAVVEIFNIFRDSSNKFLTEDKTKAKK